MNSDSGEEKMQDRNPKDLQSTIDEKYTVKIGDYISQGWRIFKKSPGLLITHSVVFTVTIVMISWIAEVLKEIVGPYHGTSVERAIASGASYTITPILLAGFVIGCLLLKKEQKLRFNDFFLGHKYILPLCYSTIFSQGLIIIGLLLFVIPGIYLLIGYLFVLPLIVDRDLNYWSAMETSRKIITKQWFLFFALYLLLSLINIAGLLLCGVGLLVTIPVTYGTIIAAYDDIIGIQKMQF
ncbi:hypothetical protein [Lusitaniella coriacea]|uniref:hypothetical protein n=1 Tax=Lusitaniella coriacea TaxID=1983105 RepID=UPI003CED6031